MEIKIGSIMENNIEANTEPNTEINIEDNREQDIKSSNEIDKENIILTNVSNLNNIKTVIEKMDKLHHIEILKILNDEKDIYINENNNGTFINLTELSKDTILKLQNYIDYFRQQQKHLINLEDKKKHIENYYFN